MFQIVELDDRNLDESKKTETEVQPHEVQNQIWFLSVL